MDSDQRNYYDILSLDRGATGAAVNAAFRRKARDLHPDRFVDDPEARNEAERLFKMVSEAYSVLRDSRLRADYDKRIATTTLAMSVEPAAVGMWTMSGSFVVRGRLTISQHAGSLPLGVRCGDVGVVLNSVDVGAGDTGSVPVSVHGYVTSGSSRAVALTYEAGGAGATQVVKLRMPPAAARRLIGYVPPPASEPAAFISFLGLMLYFVGVIPAILARSELVWFEFMLLGTLCWGVALTLAFVVSVATRGRRRMAVKLRSRW